MNIDKTDKEQLRRLERAEADLRNTPGSPEDDETIDRLKARIAQYEPKLGPDADLSKLTSTIPQ